MYKFFILATFIATILCSCNSDATSANKQDKLKIYMLDVSQGLAVLLNIGDKYAMFDTGPDSVKVIDALKAHGATSLEWITISHLHRDHVGGLLEIGALKSGIDFKELYLGSDTTTSFKDSVLSLSLARKIQPKYIGRGDTIKFADYSFIVLWPSKNETIGENAASIVLSLKVGNESLLLTGDLEAEQEKEILQMSGNIRGTILQVGHHGSNTSSSLKFLEAVAPSYALIGVGERNSYGHPTASTLSKLYYVTGDSSRVLRTDLLGTICLEWEFNVGIWPCN